MAAELKISMALCCIWAWLIPHFYIEFMEFRLAIESNRKEATERVDSNDDDIEDGDSDDSAIGHGSPSRSLTPNERAIPKDAKTSASATEKATANISDNDDDDDDSSDDGKRRSIENSFDLHDPANQALVRGSASAVLILILVYVGSAVAVALPTREMDRRADAIVVGLGRIFSAFLFAVFSIEIPKWMGVMYSSQRGNYYKQQVSSMKELSFRVCWGLLGHFFVMYCIMLLYFTKPDRWTIQLSTLIGMFFGFGVVWAVWIGRTRYKNHTALIAIIFSLAIMVSGAAAFSAGCWYIKEVWYEEDVGFREEYTLLTFFGWLAINILFNYLVYRLTRRKLAAHDGNSTTGGGASLTITKAEMDDAKSTWRYQSHIFEPPDSVCFAASELSKATAQVAVGAVRSPFKKAGSTLSRMRTSSYGSVASLTSLRAASPRTSREEDGSISRLRSFSADENNGRIQPPDRPRTNTETNAAVLGSFVTRSAHSSTNNRGRSYSDTSFSSNPEEDPVSLNSRSESNLTSITGRSSPTGAPPEQYQRDMHGLDTIKTGVSMHSDDYIRGRDLGQTFVDTQAEELITNGPSFDIEEVIPEEDDEEQSSKQPKDPSLWLMFKRNTCCWKRRHYKAPRRKAWDRVLHILKWTLWGVTSLMHVLFLIICLGATAQQTAVRLALPGTFALLYPPDYIESAMCAWNESSPYGDIRTFESPQAVMEANYTIIHCGACGSCSNWNDLSLQWTTRSNLAELGQTW
ncbi:MAG: hypothetical protein SGILL_003259 [Bacillariaceae sp.]